MAFDFLHGGIFDQWSLNNAVFKTVTDFQRFDLCGKFFDKLVVHLVLHIDAVGADTGLPSIAVFAGHSAFNSTIDIGIVKHDEGCVASEFEREFFDAGRRLRHQNTTNFGRACEADVTDRVAGAKHLAHSDAVVAVCRQDVQHASRNASAHCQLGSSQRRQRREFCGFDDHGATCCQSGCDFAGDHGEREVPRRDSRAYPNCLLDDQQAAVVVELGQGFAIDAFGFFGIPLDKTRTVGDFAFGFGKRLALLCCHDATEVFLVGHQQIKPFAQNGAAFFACFGFPWPPSGVGGGNGCFGFGWAQIGYIGEFFACGGVVHIKTAGAGDPLAVNEGVGF